MKTLVAIVALLLAGCTAMTSVVVLDQSKRYPPSAAVEILLKAPNRPYVVGYERQGCMIAILAVSRQELLNWLRPSVGWLAQRPTPPGTGARA